MNADYYQKLASRTANKNNNSMALAISTMSLGEEAGEVAGLIKKHLGHGHDLDLDKLKKELGDVLWYLTDICARVGFSLADVMEANIDKLEKRYPNGFSVEASKNRSKDDE